MGHLIKVVFSTSGPMVNRFQELYRSHKAFQASRTELGDQQYADAILKWVRPKTPGLDDFSEHIVIWRVAKE